MKQNKIQTWNQLCSCSDCPNPHTTQDIWGLSGLVYRSQSRRRDIVVKILSTTGSSNHLDVGCAEGFITSAFETILPNVSGLDVDENNLRKARIVTKNINYIRASITDIPFSNESFDSISVLEVLEHLPMDVIQKGIEEIDRVLKNGGSFLISVPYNQMIFFNKCDKCNKIFPTNKAWHLQTFNEQSVRSLLLKNYKLENKIHCVNFPLVSSSKIMMKIPIDLWIPINNFIGLFIKGDHIIFHFKKE